LKKIYVIAFLIFLVGCGSSENFSETSDTVHVVETVNPFFVLSENFATTLASFDFEFGSFTSKVDFIGRITTGGESARLEVLCDDQFFLTIFEWRLNSISQEDAIQKIRENLSAFDLQPAIFGEKSFYFLQKGLTTNIVPFKKSLLAFSFDSKNFSLVRDLIASFLIKN